MKRFVLATSRTTEEQDRAFYALLRSRFSHLGWWHQLSETWLFVDLTDKATAADLRDAAMQAFPGVYLMAFEFTGKQTWAAFGPTNHNLWIKETWDKDS